MKAIPLPFKVKDSWLGGSASSLRGYSVPEDCEPDAGYVFLIAGWISNMDDRYHYYLQRKWIYKRFTVKYWNELDAQMRPEWAGAQFGVFKTAENQIKHYRENEPKYY